MTCNTKHVDSRILGTQLVFFLKNYVPIDQEIKQLYFGDAYLF